MRRLAPGLACATRLTSLDIRSAKDLSGKPVEMVVVRACVRFGAHLFGDRFDERESVSLGEWEKLPAHQSDLEFH